MPAWSQDNGGPLTEEQIDAVVAFILSWQTGGAPDIPAFPTITPHPQLSPIPEVEGDPYLGAPLYDYNCEVCHGPDGQGRVGTALTDTWGSIRPDLAMRSTIARGVPGTAMPGWSQQYGGPLTEEEINHLVAFILSLPSIEAPQPTTPATPVVSRWIGWGGLFLAVFLFTLIIAAILILQRRRS
jgi:mono/diheme cytochrome c family protein